MNADQARSRLAVGGLARPRPTRAERDLIGVVIACRASAELASTRVSADDFGNARLRKLFTAALSIDADGVDSRVQAVAQVTGAPAELLHRIVTMRTVMFDTSGALATDVRAEADRRRKAAELFVKLRDLGWQLVEVDPDRGGLLVELAAIWSEWSA